MDPLIKYTKLKNHNQVTELLKAGADPNKLDKYNNSAILTSIYVNDPISYEMMSNKAALNNHIHLAVKYNADKVLQKMIDLGANVNAIDQYNKTPIFYSKNKNIIKILIDNGAENTFNLHKSIRNDDLNMVKYLIKDLNYNPNDLDSRDKSTLYFALQTGNIDIIQYLLDYGYNNDDITQFKNYIFNCAINHEIINVLISNQYTRNVVFMLVEMDKLKDLKHLINNKIDINFIYNGMDLYDYAANFGRHRILNYLSIYGINGILRQNLAQYYISINRQDIKNNITLTTLENTQDEKVDIIVYKNPSKGFDPFGFELCEIPEFFKLEKSRIPTDKNGEHLITCRQEVEDLYNLLKNIENYLNKNVSEYINLLKNIMVLFPIKDDYSDNVRARFNSFNDNDKAQIKEFLYQTFELGMKMRRWIPGKPYPMRLISGDEGTLINFSDCSSLPVAEAVNKGIINNAEKTEVESMKQIAEMIKNRDNMSKPLNDFFTTLRSCNVVHSINGDTYLNYDMQNTLQRYFRGIQENQNCIQQVNHMIIASAVKHIDILFNEDIKDFNLELFRFLHY